ncbi:TonB-dependent receptor plug domain-containing protein [Pseudomonas aeruginosa]|nr:TonB-dependent receptor plug domain-containing protein [Pseudomonas aeruginosa]
MKIFDEPTSRGFSPAPMYLDGLHMPYGGGSTGGALQIDPYTLERIEVLKGPASVLYGQNEPGGIVNMVSGVPPPPRSAKWCSAAAARTAATEPSTSAARSMNRAPTCTG